MTGTIQALPVDDFHRVLDILQTIDVGLVVLDKSFHVKLWNGFMENHSGQTLQQLSDKSLFQSFPDLDERWVRQKIETVFALQCANFISWELRPFLFDFQAQRPFTGMSEQMYQNITIIPLLSNHGEINHVCLIIYDVTDVATNKLALQTANAQLTELSITDRLTGLYNRGYWEENLKNEFQRFQRQQQKSTLLMMDIDHFKRINDTYGHPAGDAVLREVAARIKQVIRGSDVAGRYGGEEFGILLLNVDETIAIHVAERIRKIMEATPVVYENISISFSMSIGITEIAHGFRSAGEWLKQTDTHLYHSKHNGRNQVTNTERYIEGMRD